MPSNGHKEISNSTPIYLDYNGTCPLDVEVRDAISDAMENLWENPSSLRGRGKLCKAAIEEARQKVANMINVFAEEIIFTSGGTEANNMVIRSVIEEFHNHHHQLSNGNGTMCNGDTIGLTRIPVQSKTGAVSTPMIFEAILPNTCLITVMLANNETGVLQPVAEIVEKLLDLNKKRTSQRLPLIRLHTDAAQAIGKIRVDATGVDFLTIVGHKFYGTKIGALFVRKGTMINPMLFGGGQEKNIRPGTENTPMIVGLGEASELVTKGLDMFTNHMKAMRDYLEMRLKEIFGDDIVIHYENAIRLPNTSSIAFKNIRTSSQLLDLCKRLIASTGAACHSGSQRPSSILLACGIQENLAIRTIRFSVGRQTTKQEIDEAIKELQELIRTGST